MAYKALYRKYRPTTFDEVVGQDYIIKALNHAIKYHKIAHAYLFCGTRGTGKTTVAKIFAKSVNCLDQDNAPCNKCENCVSSDEGNNTDIIEMDAASNNGVDDVREIVENIMYAPMNGKYKVYIIDEVHMLTKEAFNALLKTLEEPPEHVIFILATTEPHKVLPTIISRCQRYDFSKVDKDSIINRLSIVAERENIEIDDNSKELIAYLSDGGMRDALSILDQCYAYSSDKIEENDIKELYGLTSTKDKVDLIRKIEEKDAKGLLEAIKALNTRGIDFKRLTNELINILKEGILYSYTKEKELLEILSKEEALILNELYSSGLMLRMIDILMETSEAYNNATKIYNYFEIASLKLMNLKNSEEKVVKKAEEEKPVTKVEEKIEIKKEINKPQTVEEKLDLGFDDEPEELSSVSIESKVISYDNEYILGLLVQCNKNDKATDMKYFNKLEELKYEMKYAKYVNLLNKTSIVASGKDCLIVSSSMDFIVNNINDVDMNNELYLFEKDILNIDKKIFAISEYQYETAINLFKERHKSGSLPSPVRVERYVPEAVEEKSDLDIVLDIFGKENVEIIKEEE